MEYVSAEPQSNCAQYCAWLAAKQAGSLTLDYMERPPGCTCPSESPVVDNKKAGFPVEREMPIIRPEVPMTPQQIEAAVKREQSPMTLYVIGAIAAYLLLMR